MSLQIEEQETHVNFNRDDERATVYTSDTTMMTKLNKLLNLQGTEWKLEGESRLKTGELIGKTYSCPVALISFRKKKKEMHLTDEQRKIVGDRLRGTKSKPHN